LKRLHLGRDGSHIFRVDVKGLPLLTEWCRHEITYLSRGHVRHCKRTDHWYSKHNDIIRTHV